MGVVVPLEEKREPLDRLKPLMALVGDDMERVNEIILDKARSDVDLIPNWRGI